MGEMTLFGGNNPLVNSDLFKSLQEMNKTLAGGPGGAGKRISLKGGKFRMFIDGEQVSVSKSDTMNVVVVNAAAVSRTYYEGTYDPSNPSAPSCWSTDTRTPAPEVPAEQKKASRCADCPMNVKGSGQGDSRACRYNQRLAITLEGKPEEVYQLQLPATSIFGEAKGGDMGMQAYAKFLNAHNTPIIAVMTEMRFDENAETPKLFFKPVRPLSEEELKIAVEMKDSEDAIKAITLTVAQTDGVQKKDKAISEKPSTKKNFTVDDEEEKPKPKAKAPVEAEEDEEVGEPKKVSASKPKEQPEAKGDLSSLVDQWDDE
jgi:hypothetical protein